MFGKKNNSLIKEPCISIIQLKFIKIIMKTLMTFKQRHRASTQWLTNQVTPQQFIILLLPFLVFSLYMINIDALLFVRLNMLLIIYIIFLIRYVQAILISHHCKTYKKS